jgi:formimidoylglutamate deiminase
MAMTDLFFNSAFLSSGWENSVRVAISEDGWIHGITPDASPEGCESVFGIAVPGVPNLHSHAFQRAMAGLAERATTNADTFWSWRERMYAFLERLGPEDIEAIAAQLYVELLRHGFTSVTEFHYIRNHIDGSIYADPVEMGQRILSAADQAGIGATLLPVLYRSSDFGSKPPIPEQRRFVAGVDELISDVAKLRDSVVNNPQYRIGLAIHSLRAVPPEDLERAVNSYRDIDREGPIHIHIAEQMREVNDCLAWSGARPVEWLLDNAPVDRYWCTIHATHMTTEEAAALAASEAVVGLCPTTEANLGDGLFRFKDFSTAEGNWGVGTDSHVSVSPIAELRLLEYGQRITRQERNVVAGAHDRSTGRVLLENAWAGGSKAAGRPTGGLEIGQRADILILDQNHAALVGRAGDEILDSWIFSGEQTPVQHVMVGGEWVIRDGHHHREEEILARYGTVLRRLSS